MYSYTNREQDVCKNPQKYYTYVVATEIITTYHSSRRGIGHFSCNREAVVSQIAHSFPTTQHHKVRGFGYKNTLNVTVQPHQSAQNTQGGLVTQSVLFTRRQFIYNPMTSKYVKAMELQIGDFVLGHMRDIWKVVSIEDGSYQEVVELCSLNRDMYTIGSAGGIGVASFSPFRENEAVESYGIIACRQRGPLETEREYLLVQRKDTMAYRDLIRGQYCNQPVEHICTIYFQEMTSSERERVLSWPFDRLWYSIWNNDMAEYFSPPVRLTRQYKEAREKYERLDMKRLVSLAGDPMYLEPEFGLPKGRPMKDETFQETAMREFTEEVGIPLRVITDHDTIEILPGPPLIEKFRATNGLRYIHTYFLAYFKNPDIDLAVDKTNEVQSSEIGSVLFTTLQSGLKRFRPYDRAKKEVLIEADLRFQKIVSLNNRP